MRHIRTVALNTLNALMICALILTSLTKNAAAVYDESFFSSNDIVFYNPNDKGCDISGTGSINLVGNGNQEKALRYFVGKNLTLAQAAGIVGNLTAESGMMPARIQGAGTKLADEDYSPVSGTGFGIAQWTTGGRQKGLVDLSSSSDRKIIDLSLQLDYVWKELDGSYKKALSSLKSADNPVDAAIAFHNGYERSADSDGKVRTVRGGIAQQLYDKYSKTVPDAENNKDGSESDSEDSKDNKDKKTDGETIDTGEDLSCTGNGTASEFIDGFPIYNQNDPQWDSKPYGTSTIGEAGCGPSAMAMIISALTGQTVTPADTANYAAEKGMYVENHGSSHAIAGVLADHWGLKAKSISPDVAAINEVLRSGGLILAVGNGPSPFTPGGHFIAIRAVTEDGKWLVGDSNGLGGGMENSKKEWDNSSILVNGVDMWAITK